MIAEELRRHEKVVEVQFNPWRFPDEVQLLQKFFSTLAMKFDALLATRGEKLSGVVNKYANVLSPIPVGGGAVSEFLKSFTSERSKADLEELKARIEQILREAEKRVVIIMDDIDRLDKEEVQALFRLVKLSADFPNTAYILAFDEKRVAEALADKYGSVEAGQNFLEKIIQVSLPLPPASLKARRAFAIEGIESALDLAKIEVTDEQKERFANLFDKAFLHRIATPRLAKRFANALTFALPIMRGEVEPIDLIFLEAIRTFYQQLYNSIRMNEDVYLGTVFDALSSMSEEEAKKYTAKVIEDALEGLTERNKKAAKVVIQELFPRTGVSGLFGAGAFGGEYDSAWSVEKRIAAKDYFPRYFNYGVPPDDISDREINQFLGEIATEGVDYVTAKINELTANKRADLLIRKLRSYEDELPSDIAKPLALGIALSGNILLKSHPTDSFFGLGAYAQASTLIRLLIHSLTDLAEREQFALEIARHITPLSFAYEYSSRMRPMKRTHHSEEKIKVVSEGCEEEIRKIIVARIAVEANEEPLESKYPLDAQNLYRFWFGIDGESLRNYLDTRLRTHPTSAARFLAGVLQVDPDAESDKSFDFPDQQGWFNLIAQMVDPKIVMAGLSQSFLGIDSPTAISGGSKKISGEKRVARWFARMYQQAQSNDS